MNETPWERLHRLAMSRIEHLGITQSDLQTKFGGPSPAWLRGLKNVTGEPSTKRTRALNELSQALGWNAGTARSLVQEDRSDWDAAALEAEEHDLVFGDDLTGVEVKIRDFQTMVATQLRLLPEADRAKAMKKISQLLHLS